MSSPPIQSNNNTSQSPNFLSTVTAIAVPPKKRAPENTRLLLTYPQCQTTKEQVVQNLTVALPDRVRFYVVAEETHESGDPHLHVLLGLKGRMLLSSQTNHNLLDKLVTSDHHPEGKHGNYQTVRSLKKVMEYVTKEGRYLASGIDVTETLRETEKEKKRKEREEIVGNLMNGMSPSEVMEQYTTFYFVQRKRIQEFAQDVQLLKLSSKKLEKVVTISSLETTTSSSISGLISWLNENVLESNRKTRAPRQKQLWLHGPPRLGKSRMINQLSKYLRIYEIPTEDWYDQYRDDAYDLAVMDEFTGQKPIWWLNRWLDGNQFHLKQRNAPGTLKLFNIPTIIVSNYHPEAVFTSTKITGSLQGLMDRLDIIYIEETFEIKIETEKENENVVIDLT